jgi:hypothetical protein
MSDNEFLESGAVEVVGECITKASPATRTINCLLLKNKDVRNAFLVAFDGYSRSTRKVQLVGRSSFACVEVLPGTEKANELKRRFNRHQQTQNMVPKPILRSHALLLSV